MGGVPWERCRVRCAVGGVPWEGCRVRGAMLGVPWEGCRVKSTCRVRGAVCCRVFPKLSVGTGYNIRFELMKGFAPYVTQILWDQITRCSLYVTKGSV